MPRGDGTGPTGMGAMTGRAAGYCAGTGMPGFANFAPGRGFGMNSGRMRCFSGGRGNRNRFYAAGIPGRMSSNEYAAPHQKLNSGMEKQALRDQASALQSELDFIKKRLEEIESNAGTTVS